MYIHWHVNSARWEAFQSYTTAFVGFTAGVQEGDYWKGLGYWEGAGNLALKKVKKKKTRQRERKKKDIKKENNREGEENEESNEVG